MHITKIKVFRAITSAVFIYFLIVYILQGRLPQLSIGNLVEFLFQMVFIAIIFIGQGFISAFFQRLGNTQVMAFGVKLAEFVVNFVYILLLNYCFFYLPLRMLYPGSIVPSDVLRLVYGIHLLVGLTHYYLLERERSQQKLTKVQLETEKVAKENFEARLLMVKKQLNPQFLYNSLKQLRQLVRGNKPKARFYLQKLSEIYRMFLHQVDQTGVSLKEEQALLLSYGELLKMEYGDRIGIINYLPEEEEHYFLPSGLCQVILEDWVACLSEKEELKLQVTLKLEAKALVLSGKFSQTATPHQGESIRHIRSTYQLHTENSCTPEIMEGIDYSTISLPLFSTISLKHCIPVSEESNI